MKKITSILLCLMLVFLASASVFAADSAPQIIWQPQNPSYNPYAVATYSVTAQGENLSCTWHLVYDGVDYNISLFDDSYEPWEWYAGEQYGVYSEEFEGYTTFYYYFQGIGEELSGASIYAVIDNGSGSVTSDVALINVVDGVTTPPKTAVPASVEVYQGEEFTLHCEASAADGAPLSYLWYSTSTGKLQNIIAVNRGSEDKADLLVDTTTLGTVYYCCMVTSASGGSTYTSMIPVTVVEPKSEQIVENATEKTETESPETESPETKAPETDDNSQPNESPKVELDTLHVALIAGCALLVGCLGALIFKKR